MTNIEKYKKDLDSLCLFGERLELAFEHLCRPALFRERYEAQLGAKLDSFIGSLPLFDSEYQTWYSESLAMLRQLLPDRVANVAAHYDKPKARKEITFENYRIEDALQGLQISRLGSVILDKSAATPHIHQQNAILSAAKRRFTSTLFDIRKLVQADLFDHEIEAAKSLAKHRYYRASGALTGVVLERHLKGVCEDRSIRLTTKNATIAVLNEALKSAEVIDIPTWRQIQFLTDLRNLCDHSRDDEPTKENIDDLISGVAKIIKVVY